MTHMKQPPDRLLTSWRPVLAVLAVVAAFAATSACITSYNRYKWTALAEAPPVEPRPEGCHVDVFEDGQKVTRPHADLGAIVLEWPQQKLDEQGPEGAITTLKAAACEQGAFIIKDLRALPRGPKEGLVYDATLATLLDENGRPLNLKVPKEPAAGTADGTPDAGPTPSP